MRNQHVTKLVKFSWIWVVSALVVDCSVDSFILILATLKPQGVLPGKTLYHNPSCAKSRQPNVYNMCVKLTESNK